MITIWLPKCGDWAKGFVYLDYFSSLADERNGMKAALTMDGVHANIEGYKVMEPLAEVAIQKALHQR